MAATSAPQTDAMTPSGSPASNAAAGNSSELQRLNLQIEKKKQLEISLLELEAQAKAWFLMPTSPSKPRTIPSLDTVRAGVNTGKMQGQLDHNTSFVNPQEWPQLHIPFGRSCKKFEDLSTAEFVYGYLDILPSDTLAKQALMQQHFM